MQTIIEKAFGIVRLGKCAALAPVIGGIFLAAGSFGVSAAEVTFERLLNPEPHNWLMVHRDYTSQRHSALDQINKSNIKNMKLHVRGGDRRAHRPTRRFEATPLVDDGFMYVIDGWGAVYKIDVRSGNHGRILWKMDPGMKRYGRIRGVALWGNLVISPTGKDGRVIATDKDTGKIVWDKNLARPPGTGIVRGAAGAEGRHHHRRFRRRSGHARLDRVARPENRRSEVEDLRDPRAGRARQRNLERQEQAWKTGGGAFYVTGSYDPQTNLTYWGSGNPVPGYDATLRPGDNLFTDSAIAFDVANGKMEWYFQYTPNDSRDYDETGTHVLIDTKVNGQDRKIVTHPGRNGFNYTFDRAERPVSQRRPVCRQGHLDQGHRSEDRQARRLRPDQGPAVLCRAGQRPGRTR